MVLTLTFFFDYFAIVYPGHAEAPKFVYPKRLKDLQITHNSCPVQYNFTGLNPLFNWMSHDYIACQYEAIWCPPPKSRMQRGDKRFFATASLSSSDTDFINHSTILVS